MGQALWFTSRGTGLVSLLLLTATVGLGAAHAARWGSTRWPRFTVAALHRNLSLLAVVFLAAHVATAVIDPYAGIRWLDAVLPFGSTYHPFWLGLGRGATPTTSSSPGAGPGCPSSPRRRANAGRTAPRWRPRPSTQAG